MRRILRNRLARVEVLGAGGRAVHDGVAPVHLGSNQLVQPLTSVLVPPAILKVQHIRSCTVHYAKTQHECTLLVVLQALALARDILTPKNNNRRYWTVQYSTVQLSSVAWITPTSIAWRNSTVLSYARQCLRVHDPAAGVDERGRPQELVPPHHQEGQEAVQQKQRMHS